MSTTLKLSLDQYHAMIERGAFAGKLKHRVQLIHGELRHMAPQGPWHSDTLTWLAEWSQAVVAKDQARIRVQLPISLPDQDSEPEPDIVWAMPGSYRRRHPHAEDVLLVIEVAFATVTDDLRESAELFSSAGLREYWVVDLPAAVVHVFRQPSPQGYQAIEQFGDGSSIHPLAFPHVTLVVSDLFAEP